VASPQRGGTEVTMRSQGDRETNGADPDLPRLYAARFDQREISAKDSVWREIVRFLQRYIDEGSPLLDIACDQGHFVRHAMAAERWATDIRDVSAGLPKGIRFVQASGLELLEHCPAGTFGTIFMSNYLEHLDSSDAVIEQLRVASELLRPKGRVIVLQPNIRLVGPRYWDFIDHKVALTERSLLEAAELAGLRTVELITRFLPYSTKGRLPTHPLLVKAYLRTRPAWWLLGRQTLYIGERVAPR
jgi:SAM-dependent methyltransferase